MRFRHYVCLLLGSLAFGQLAPQTPASTGSQTGNKVEQPAPAPPEKPEVKVAPDDAVITVKGFCADNPQPGDACKTVITRAQFEKLAEALQPNMSPAVRRNLANTYALILRMSVAAEKRGLDKTPRFDEIVAFTRMQILRQELSRALQEDANRISDEDIDAYYKKNEASYEQATLARIFIPRAKQISTAPSLAKTAAKTPAKPATNEPPSEEQKKASEEAMTKLAANLRARAVKGEDPDALEKEAYKDAGLPGSPMSTKMERVRRTTLPASQQSVMDLKVGEVSEVITDDNSGHYIYKMISKETLPLDTMKAEIRNMISSQRYRDSMQAFQGNVDLNEAYFGGGHGPLMPQRPRGAKPSDMPASDPD